MHSVLQTFLVLLVFVYMFYIFFPDKYYWTHGYSLTSGKVEESVPLFVKELANDIFICGKSINLLKACNRQVGESLIFTGKKITAMLSHSDNGP